MLYFKASDAVFVSEKKPCSVKNSVGISVFAEIQRDSTRFNNSLCLTLLVPKIKTLAVFHSKHVRVLCNESAFFFLSFWDGIFAG